MNSCNFIGRLARDPELRQTQSGISVATFAIAVERSFKDSNTGKRPVDFINCVAWRQTGELIARYFQKGNFIGIVGRLEVRNYEAKDGSKKSAHEIQVDNFSFCGGQGEAKGAAQQAPSAQPSGGDPSTYTPPGFQEVNDDELPF